SSVVSKIMVSTAAPRVVSAAAPSERSGTSRINFAEIPPTAGAENELSSSSRLAQRPVGSNSLNVRYIVTGSSTNPSSGGSSETPTSWVSVTSAAANGSRSTTVAGGDDSVASSSVGAASG